MNLLKPIGVKLNNFTNQPFIMNPYRFKIIPYVPTDKTRGIIAGGEASGTTNVIEYITIASTSGSSDFGDLTTARMGLAGVGSDLRGVFGGGYMSGGVGSVNIVDYVTIDTTGNASDFGDLIVGNQTQAGMSSTTRGVMAGGHDGGKTENIGYITIANTGNEQNFGDLSVAKNNCGGV